ncbi:hypothetical protein Tco_1461096 [Tanacetum coccineum]
MYMCEKTAKEIRWHEEGRTKDGKLRHSTDALAWKAFDARYTDFAYDPRSVRLSLASDGFNPFHIMNEKGPGNDIDIYLQPLIHELKLLWADWSTTGRVACPNYANLTRSNWLKHGRKFCYMGHHRWLEKNHNYRLQKDRFDGTLEEEGPPTQLIGSDILKQVSDGRFKYGKSDNFSKKRTSYGECCSTDTHLHTMEATNEESAFEDTENVIEEDVDGEHQLWKKKSVFFELPYWEYNLLRHNLDVMHIEKNVFDNVLGTLLNLDGKTKDNENSRKDLKKMGIRHELHLINRPNKKAYLTPACYTMTSVEKSNFLQILKNLKIPNGYASNISRGVSLKDRKIINLKSHDGHILMQDILPIALRASMFSRSQTRVVKAISDLCSFFKGLCNKVLDMCKLDKMEHDVVQTLCDLEQLFPPSFFTIMVHLTVHLISEAKLGGPVHYRWMYPVER